VASVAVSEALRDAGDRWHLDLSGAVVDQCCFDYAVVLRLSRVSWELRIEQPFSVTTSDGKEFLVIPEEGAHLDVVLDNLLRGTVKDAFAFKDGRFELRLVDGTVVEVPPEEGFEAWVITGPAGVRIVSLPGGDLAVWNSVAVDRGDSNC
jgi:hypothetical protein